MKCFPFSLARTRLEEQARARQFQLDATHRITTPPRHVHLRVELGKIRYHQQVGE